MAESRMELCRSFSRYDLSCQLEDCFQAEAWNQVVKNKQAREEKILEALIDVQKQFPRLQGRLSLSSDRYFADLTAVYKTIYPTEELEALIANVFKLVIKFLRESTKY